MPFFALNLQILVSLLDYIKYQQSKVPIINFDKEKNLTF